MFVSWPETCPGFVSSGADYIYFFFGGGGQTYFLQGQNCGRRNKNLLSLNRFLPPGNNTQEGAEYLIITKERLDWASAPYAPHESFYYQGQKHFISTRLWTWVLF